jgi:hypothetical protein
MPAVEKVTCDEEQTYTVRSAIAFLKLMEISMMTESTNELPNSRKLTRLDIYFVTTSEEDDENEINKEDLPRWTVVKRGEEYLIREGLALIKNALARRFKTLELKRSVTLSVAIDLRESEVSSRR